MSPTGTVLERYTLRRKLIDMKCSHATNRYTILAPRRINGRVVIRVIGTRYRIVHHTEHEVVLPIEAAVQHLMECQP